MLSSAPGKLVNGNLLFSSPLRLLSNSCLQQYSVRRKIDSKRPSLRGFCTSVQKEQPQLIDEDVSVMCEPCNGRGWVLCDFCKGEKNNVKSSSGRFYRRCPTCKAAGYVLCSKCKVYKCVTFPNNLDNQL